MSQLPIDKCEVFLGRTPLRNLVHIDFSWCVLRVVPQALRHARSLRILQLPDNQLTRLPDFISTSNMPDLTYLDVRRNDLRSLPCALGQFEHLNVIYAMDNPNLHEHLAVQVRSGHQHLVRYLRDCAAGSQEAPLTRCRLVLLGLLGSGKTSIAENLVDEPSFLFFRRRMASARHPTVYPILLHCERKLSFNIGEVRTVHVRLTDPPGTYTVEHSR